MLGVNWRRTSFVEKKIFHKDKLEMSLAIILPISTFQVVNALLITFRELKL